jgi:S1-C subfamily serine protease
VLDDQGHILTNNHVVTPQGSRPASLIAVDLPDGRTVPANVVGTDPQTDLAVLQVGSDARGDLKSIEWADPSGTVVGERVVAIGYALNLGGAPSVTTGVVSAVDRNIPESDSIISGSVQTDAAINPGNSGGPLLNYSGRVVGINTSGISRAGGTPIQGLNFAVSSQTAQPVASALISQGRVVRGYLGAALTDITPAMARANDLGVSAGAGVGMVSPGSPAERAGLMRGDVIVKMGDVDVNNTGDLTNALTWYSPGQQVPITYVRGKERRSAMVTLSEALPSR